MSKMAAVFIVLTILIISFSAYGQNIQTEEQKDPFAHNEINGIIAAINQEHAGQGALNDITTHDQFAAADDQQKVEILLDLADEMTYAELYDIVNADIMLLAGNAVQLYPHPLLLNNYASMLMGRADPSDVAFLFQQALTQDPDNPVILTNTANAFLELEDFAAAYRYATMALAASENYGPAYQVLTTVHLKNGDCTLAAETMVKSAVNCFDDITMYHFDSFLSAVSSLDPE